jgi:hypothetical protein
MDLVETLIREKSACDRVPQPPHEHIVHEAELRLGQLLGPGFRNGVEEGDWQRILLHLNQLPQERIVRKTIVLVEDLFFGDDVRVRRSGNPNPTPQNPQPGTAMVTEIQQKRRMTWFDARCLGRKYDMRMALKRERTVAPPPASMQPQFRRMQERHSFWTADGIRIDVSRASAPGPMEQTTTWEVELELDKPPTNEPEIQAATEALIRWLLELTPTTSNETSGNRVLFLRLDSGGQVQQQEQEGSVTDALLVATTRELIRPPRI